MITRNLSGDDPGSSRAAAERISTAAQPQDRQQHRTATTDVPRALGTRYIRADTAQNDRVLARCPLCGRAHLHVLFEAGASQIERSPACARHRRYVVEIVAVFPPSVSRRAA